MEFQDVIRRQRMRRPPYEDRPVPPDVLDRILRNAQKSPSAGFSQGFAFLVLEGEQTETFWEITHPRGNRPKTPVIVLPLENKQAYLDRYSAPDKQATGLGGNEAAWPVPYWTVDTSFASMIVMLSATAEGVGCWFFGVFANERELLDTLGVPDTYRAIGAIALGYPTPREQRSPSLKRGRTPWEDFVKRGRW